MELFIMRHALAGDPDPIRWSDDALRPLTAEGETRFAAMVETLAKRDFSPTIIATSPLVRCRQTAEIVSKSLPLKPTVVELEALAPGADLTQILTWTCSLPDKSIAWVGHAPDVTLLTAAMIGDGSAGIRFKKGAVACIRFEDLIHRGRGELLWLATAKLLGC